MMPLKRNHYFKVFNIIIFFYALITIALFFSACSEESELDLFEAVISVAANDVTLTEGSDNLATFTFSMDKVNTSGAAINVVYTVTGTAESGSDYEPVNGSAQIEEGSNLVEVQITIIDDNALESDENVLITLVTSNLPEGITVLGNTVATVTIEDNDNRTLNVTASDAQALEGDNNGEFTISIDQPLSNALTVDYTMKGTAINGDDYSILNGVVEIAAGSTSTIVKVEVTDDTNIESNETVILQLSTTQEPGINLGTSLEASVTIADNDEMNLAAIVTISASDNTALEGDNDGVFTVSLDQTNTTGATISIAYTVSGTATGSTDYTSLNGAIEIPNNSSSATIAVSVIDDAEAETDETVIVSLDSSQPNGISLGNSTSATVIISDNDEMNFAAIVTITASDNTAMEGDNDGMFTVTLDQTNTTGAAISIAYTVSGTAIGSTDYTSLNGVIEIPNNSATATIAVSVIDDVEVETDETVIITLNSSQPSGISLGSSSSATITISDNDTEATSYLVTLTSQNSSVMESDPGSAFKVVLDKSNDTGADISVSYNVTGSATSGLDFTAPSGTAVISNGAIDALVELPIINDVTIEGDETIIITLIGSGLPATVALGNPSTITITIVDDESVVCSNDNSIDQNNWNCDESPVVGNSYTESISGDVRNISTNGVPEHDYRNQIPDIVSSINTTTKNYSVDATPSLAATVSELALNGTPQWKFGVAKNGVPIDPAPAQPFIFENTSTGEYNWDYMMEPNNNMEAVGLDCSVSHFQPDGQLHYHGNMSLYADQLLSGLGAGSTIPSNPVRIGWAADGFPIVYEYGPNASGVLTKLTASYQLKSGERPGDGVSEPCGEYNGKYTSDYEYVSGLGDLDECNGFAHSITVDGETFNYFYVITDTFPYISRCISGTPDNTFKIGI